MKKTTKLFASLALATTMLASIGLTGCGGSGGTDSKNANNKNLNIMTISSGVDDDTLNGTTASVLNDQTGYNVTWSQLNSDSQAASAQLTSIFTTSTSSIDAVKLSRTQLYQYMNSGALTDLTEYVNNSEYLKDQISDLGWSMCSKDGKIYAIPQKAPTLTNNVLLVYRQDWLNEYNAKNPTDKIEVPSEDNGYAMTLSNFKKMTDFFSTDKNVDGFVVGQGLVFQENILPAFGIYGEFTDIDGTLYYETEHPNFPAYMEYMQSLNCRYNRDGASATEPLTSFVGSKCGAARVAFWNGVQLSSMMEDGKVGYIQALVDDQAADESGHIDKTKVRVIATDSYTYFTVVPARRGATVAAKVVDFADKLLEPVLFKRAIIGIENTHYEKGDDGLDWPILERFGELDVADKYLIGTREEDYSTYWWTRARKNNASYELTLVAFNNIKNVGIKCCSEAMPPLDKYNDYQAGAISEMTSVLMLAMFPSANAETYTLEDVNAKYREYHGDEVVTAVNAWYKTWESRETFNTVQAPVYTK